MERYSISTKQSTCIVLVGKHDWSWDLSGMCSMPD